MIHLRAFPARTLLALFLLSLAPFPTTADEGEPIVIGHRIQLDSKILGEEREVLVHTPAGYEQSALDYPVAYLLDANTQFIHTAGLLAFLSGRGRVPEMILVAVVNTDRTRDLSLIPSAEGLEQFPTAGGADTFLDFIESELMPAIAQRYRTNRYSVLIGHSLGGLLSIHTIANRPKLFNAHIALSPPLEWNDDLLLRTAAQYLQAPALDDRYLYLAVGSDELESFTSAYDGMRQELSRHARDGFHWSGLMVPGENHATMPHRAIYFGLEAIFNDWNFTIDEELAGQDGLQMAIDHYQSLSERIGVTIAPSEGGINTLGYFYLGQDDPKMAVRAFEYNVKHFPRSANVYDSLGDGLKADGNLKKALRNYRKAVKLGEKNGSPNLEAYRRNVAETRAALEAS